MLSRTLKSQSAPVLDNNKVDRAGTLRAPSDSRRIIQKDTNMNKERLEGAAQKSVGSVKEAVGKAIGNPKLEAEGLGDKIAGSAKETIGKAEDAMKAPKK